MDPLSFAEKHFGGGWVVGVIALIVAVANTGIVQHFFRERRAGVRSDRDRVSDDQHNLFRVMQAENAALSEEIDEVRRRRAADRAEHQAEADRLRRQRDEAVATIVSMERGRARERHALVGALQYIQVLRDGARRAGVAPPPFDGWRELMGIDAHLDTSLRAMFGED